MRQQVKGVEQANQSKIVIAMEVRNKDVRDLASAHFVFDHLDLCAFTAVDQVTDTILRNHLAGWMAVEGRYRRIVPQNRYR
jgi:hypothetical protein